MAGIGEESETLEDAMLHVARGQYFSSDYNRNDSIDLKKTWQKKSYWLFLSCAVNSWRILRPALTLPMTARSVIQDWILLLTSNYTSFQFLFLIVIVFRYTIVQF